MDNALSFQKKRNETTGLDEVPAVRASCFVAWLPIGSLDGGSTPVLQPGNGQPVRTPGEACSRGILLISIQAAIHDVRDWPFG
ncbi:hypothetical protein [Paraburkholderia domus]|uniref:hypothetical protein n=1 Tax=Paraburkholderia domus TaxID=2793075 RepID=UPI001B8C2D06|nr:hypothetical protein [Paraburkholderia domus]